MSNILTRRIPNRYLVPFVFLLSVGAEARWVSYLKGAQLRALEHVTQADSCGLNGCEWRLFDPESKQDYLFSQVQKIPKQIFWDKDFKTVSFISGGKVYKQTWALGSVAERVADLPQEIKDQAKIDIFRLWIDSKSGLYNMITSYDQPLAAKGSVTHGYQRITWEHQPEWGWRKIGQCTKDCPEVSEIKKEPGLKYLEDLEAPAIAESSPLVKSCKTGKDEDETPCQFSAGDTDITVNVIAGDNKHFAGPLKVASHKSLQTITLLTASQAMDCSGFNQIQLDIDGNYLLAGTEFSGKCPKLVDLKNLSEAPHDFPQGTVMTFWITPPKVPFFPSGNYAPHSRPGR